MKEKEKLLTIIIATYNAGKTLNRCLSSIMSQKNDRVEIAVIDGHSTDNTIDIVESYGNNVDVFVSEKDAGLYDAWNKGVKRTSGEWVMFLGADDMLLPKSINMYLEYLGNIDTTGIDLVTAKANIVDENGILLKTYGKQYRWDEFRSVFTISHGSTLHNRKLFDEIGLFDTNLKICADYDFLLRKKMNTRFIDKITISMQNGGMSVSYEAIKEAFSIKRKHKANPLVVDLYQYTKGVLGLYVKQHLY